MNNKQNQTSPNFRFVFGIFAAIVIVYFLWEGCSNDDDKETDNKNDDKQDIIVGEKEEEEVKQEEPSVLEILYTIDNLPDALEYLKPMMGDTNNEVSKGALLLTYWLNKHQSLDELKKINKTSYKLAKKDAISEIGKLICSRIKINQISIDHSLEPPIATGTLMSGWTSVYHYIAVGSTGELVEKKYTRFCGIVTGRYSYSNVSGGTTHSIQVVGMFDIKENRGNRKTAK